ncbi:unnamed protein product [Boreogadus saida]
MSSALSPRSSWQLSAVSPGIVQLQFPSWDEAAGKGVLDGEGVGRGGWAPCRCLPLWVLCVSRRVKAMRQTGMWRCFPSQSHIMGSV